MPKTEEELQAEQEAAKKLEEELKDDQGDAYEELYTPPHQQLGYDTEEDMVATLETENAELKEKLNARDEQIKKGAERKGFDIPVTAEEFADDPKAATQKIVEAAMSQVPPSTSDGDRIIELDQALNKEVRAAGLKGYDEDFVFSKMLSLSKDPKNARLKESKEGIADLGEMAMKEVDRMVKRKTPAPPEHSRAPGTSGDSSRRTGDDKIEGEIDYDKEIAVAGNKGDLVEVNRLAFEKHAKQAGKALSDAKK